MKGGSDEGEGSKQGEGMPPLEHLHLHHLEGGAGAGRVKEKVSDAAEARKVLISSLVLLALLALWPLLLAFGQEQFLLIHNF